MERITKFAYKFCGFIEEGLNRDHPAPNIKRPYLVIKNQNSIIFLAACPRKSMHL